MTALVWLALGIVALIAGGELIVRGGARLAARLGTPPIVIGLTVVAVGTSTPELAVGIDAGLAGAGSLAVGNIAGTNTVNILLILGLSALIRPLALHLHTLRFDLPIMTVVAAAMLAMAFDGTLSRSEGAILVAASIAFTVEVVRWARNESAAVRREFAAEFTLPRAHEARAFAADATWLVLGIGFVVIGADWLVDAAVDIARAYGVSEAFIGLTIVAVGTSAPELVTTIIGTLRDNREIAIGNLIGSSVYNILLILGLTCIVPAAGLEVSPELVRVDIPVMTTVAFLCIPVFVSGRRVTRVEGAMFVAAYAAYVTYLVIART